MKRLFYAATVYLALGLGSGLLYREFTKANSYTAANGFTQLSVVHTHLLTLGVIVLLIVLALEKVFELSRSPLFGWFFWLYNVGLVISTTTMVVNGVLHVVGNSSSAVIAGISGAGPMILTSGLILLFVALGQRVLEEPTRETV
jgi:nitric oxide reductase large subunit